MACCCAANRQAAFRSVEEGTIHLAATEQVDSCILCCDSRLLLLALQIALVTGINISLCNMVCDQYVLAAFCPCATRMYTVSACLFHMTSTSLVASYGYDAIWLCLSSTCLLHHQLCCTTYRSRLLQLWTTAVSHQACALFTSPNRGKLGDVTNKALLSCHSTVQSLPAN